MHDLPLQQAVEEEESVNEEAPHGDGEEGGEARVRVDISGIVEYGDGHGSDLSRTSLGLEKMTVDMSGEGRGSEDEDAL